MPDIADGELIRGLDFPSTVYAVEDTVQPGSASSTYITGTPELGVYFIAPQSGRVILTVGGSTRDPTNDFRTFLSPQVFENSSAGTEILAPSVESYGWCTPGVNSGFLIGSRSSLLGGLTPGNVYYARVMMSHEGLTTEVSFREITVEPVS